MHLFRKPIHSHLFYLYMYIYMYIFIKLFITFIINLHCATLLLLKNEKKLQANQKSMFETIQKEIEKLKVER